MSFKRGPIELRQGPWQRVLIDVTAEAVIADPPYSARTHAGERGMRNGKPDGAIGYSAITPSHCKQFFDHWRERSRNWFCLFADHIAFQWWADAAACAGLYSFAPVVWLKSDAPPRFAGDGPANCAEYLFVARPKRKPAKPGSRPGVYSAKTQSAGGFVGAKDVAAMRALIRDYTSPGDLVCDPYAGSGSTLLAAAIEGRRAIGAEADPETFKLACERIARGWTPDLFGGS